MSINKAWLVKDLREAHIRIQELETCLSFEKAKVAEQKATIAEYEARLKVLDSYPTPNETHEETKAELAGLQAENERLRQSTAEADKILADGIVELQTELANAHEMNWQLRKMVLKVDHPETVRRMRKIETKYRRVGQPHETVVDKEIRPRSGS